ncbi:hypothetical protein UA08_08379 [Talaromyces atroroseus]|uniref:ATP-dependent helicase n=1 Tax=Talaromyces atroroseus TaxID=1441469 RepID=A0A1Q5Q854_TALAT|nr:hypothetical protein UA08_08379 [Talaromyces atroroseus]OKL56232.1 hypothetical protein UA08_08379 [Talaromyces atroroseus]
MVHEVNPPKGPLSSWKSNEQKQDIPSTNPEFGKTTPLRSIQSKSQVPFNIPKNNRPRAEHHRPPSRVPSQPSDGSDLPKKSTSKQPFDPFKPVIPSTYTTQRSLASFRGDDHVVEIPRPSQFTWTTKQAPPAVFSSKPSAPPAKMSNSSKTLQKFMDLTGNEDGFSSNFALRSTQREEFGSANTYSYIDSVKAQEDIKALLEGAFEDEEDKPRTRARKKKVEADINDLAAKFQQVSVDSKHEDENKEVEQEDEDEEEIDDGTREGLKIKLLPHQIEGVSWIPSDQTKLKDGERKDSRRQLPEGVGKGTLIVAPLALIKQWESEIEDKIEKSHRLRVCVYHGTGRAKHSADLKDFDVVITTYGTLSSEHAASGKGQGGCFNVHWYRIILDEAHTIKNRNAKATQAACALDAQYRWCLTGTPLQNNLDELQSLIKFLRIQPYDELSSWREQITQPLNNGRGGLAIQRLQVYLKAFMKRRTKDVLRLNNNLEPEEGRAEDGSKQESSTGFQIVKREVIKIETEFTEAENDFYQRLEQRTDRRLSQMMGGSKLDYASALVMLLRLRQACNHPDLVKSDLAEDKDILLNNDGKQSKASKQDEDLDKMADLFGGLSVVSKKCDICQVDLTVAESKTGASRCSECADLGVDLKTTKKKRRNTDRKPKVINHTSEAREARARRNRRVIEDSSDEDENDGDWVVPRNQRPSSLYLGKAGGSNDEDAEGGEWIGSEDSDTEDDANEVVSVLSSTESADEDDDGEGEDDGGLEMAPSTKIRALMRILRKEAPEYKFIVFSVFTTMLDKIEPFLKHANLGYARYDGSMRNDLREASLNQLRSRSSTRILLCSLRAGSLGLNLTAASRVVILEPFWNPFVEEQAIDRVHRLNQTIDVKIYKITIKNSVEERILDLQERKRELANATIEGKMAAGKLGLRDMMALFGRDAESRFDDERDAPDLTQKTKLLVSKDDGYEEYSSSRTGDVWSLASSQPSSQDRRRRQAQKPVRGDDSIYGRRWD